MEAAEKNKNLSWIALVVSFVLMLAGAVMLAKPTLFKKKVTIHPGTQILAVLNTSINSASNNIGDIVVATVSSPVVSGENLAIPVNSKIYGTISQLERAQNTGEVMSGLIGLSFNKIEFLDGSKYDFYGTTQPYKGELATQTTQYYQGKTRGQKVGGVAKSSLLGAATGAALGTAVGAIAGGGRGAGRGAWSGAAIGGGLGAVKGAYGAANDAGTLVTGTKQIGQDIVLKSGDQISVVVSNSLNVTEVKP